MGYLKDRTNTNIRHCLKRGKFESSISRTPLTRRVNYRFSHIDINASAKNIEAMAILLTFQICVNPTSR